MWQPEFLWFFDTVVKILGHANPLRAWCNASVVCFLPSALDSRIMSRAIRPSKRDYSIFTGNWLRVFRSTGASYIGHRRRQQRHTRVVWSEKCRELCGTVWHKMQAIAGFFASGARAALLVHGACFLPLLQEVSSMCKTRNQLYVINSARWYLYAYNHSHEERRRGCSCLPLLFCASVVERATS